MCNRYRLDDPAALQVFLKEIFGVEIGPGGPRYNVGPNQEMPIVTADETGRPAARIARWNLVPASERPGSAAFLRTNARSEEVLTKRSYKAGIQSRRCVVPADGFYEWEHLLGGRVKLPWAFELAPRRPFVFAGLWEPGIEDLPPSYTILTTSPNALVAKIHDRMPVLLADADALAWLRPGPMTPETLAPFVQPFPPERMRSYRVNPALNSVRNDTAEAAAPYVEPGPDEFKLE